MTRILTTRLTPSLTRLTKLPDNYKSLVIQEWLKGEQRDKIAADNGLSAGSVTNIVNEWRTALGFPTADALRELGVTLRKLGIAAAQCALGWRISTLMHRIELRKIASNVLF